MDHGIFEGTAIYDGNHEMTAALLEVGLQQGLNNRALAIKQRWRELDVLHAAGMILGREARERIEHGSRTTLVGTTLRIIGGVHIHASQTSVGRCCGVVAPLSVELVVADDDEEILHADVDAALAHTLRHKLVEVIGHRVGGVEVVAVFIARQTVAAQLFVALEIGQHGIVELAQGVFLLTEYEVADSPERVAGVDVAVGLVGATQVAHTTIEDGPSALNAIISEQRREEERHVAVHHLVAVILRLDREIEIVVKQAFVSIVEILERLVLLQRFDGHAATFIDAIHGVDATIHINGEQLEQVDADVGCARALSLDDELRTAKGHILLCCLFTDTHAVSHGRDVHIVVVERGVGGTGANGIEGLVPDLL